MKFGHTYSTVVSRAFIAKELNDKQVSITRGGARVRWHRSLCTPPHHFMKSPSGVFEVGYMWEGPPFGALVKPVVVRAQVDTK